MDATLCAICLESREIVRLSCMGDCDDEARAAVPAPGMDALVDAVLAGNAGGGAGDTCVGITGTWGGSGVTGAGAALAVPMTLLSRV